MTDLMVRAATARDRDVVAALFHAIEVHYWGERAVTLNAMTRHVTDRVLAEGSGCEVVLAERDGRALGLASFAVLYPAPGTGGTLYMKDLFAVAEARGAGVGRRLLSYLARLALERGCVRFDWTAERSNPSALHYYDRLGVRRVEDKVYYRLDGESLEAMATQIRQG